MAAAFPNIGSKSTVAFTTQALTDYCAGLLGIELSGLTRASIDIGNMATAGARPFISGATFDPGQVVLTCHFDPDTDPEDLLEAAIESITINISNDSGTKAKWVFSGFVTDVGVSIPWEEVMTTDVTVKIGNGFAHTANGA